MNCIGGAFCRKGGAAYDRGAGRLELDQKKKAQVGHSGPAAYDRGAGRLEQKSARRSKLNAGYNHISF
jgi:hypothetical protein